MIPLDPLPPIATSWDDEGTPTAYLQGYHVNAPEPVPGWEQYRVYPKQPSRVYAGCEPVCYRFADEAEFEKERDKIYPGDEL